MKDNMSILVYEEKAIKKFQHQFMIKIPRKLRIEGSFINLTKGIYEKQNLQLAS